MSDGVRMIPVETPSGSFDVWTRKAGDNPRLRLLLLHGGPGATHEYLLPMEQELVDAGVEVHFYDQLGSHFSDQPDEPSLWEIDRFVDEVEQVRVALGLGRDDFVLYGQSWGGVLGIEYALAHQEHLKGLVVSNMMASVPAYNDYAERVLMPTMDQTALAEIKRLEADGETDDPSYEQLLMEHHYVHHVLRRPADEWPEEVVRSLGNTNRAIYVPMQGPSELGASGKLLHWDRSEDLRRIEVPTLVMGAEHDTMDPGYLRWMAGQLPSGRYHHSPEGSHIALVDDHATYLTGLVDFLHDLEKADAPRLDRLDHRGAILVLEDGRTFRGESYGAEGETFGEAVFSTGMTGYQETLTDPSYHRQVVVMTAPHVGNTGMNDDDPESSRIWVSGYVVRDPARVPSSWRSVRSLDDELRAQGVVGISGVDTRALTRHLRERGAMRVGISTLTADSDDLLQRVLASAEMTGAELAGEVSTTEAYVVPAVGDEAVHGRRARPRDQGEHPADDGRARYRGARAPRHRDARRRARGGARRPVLLQRPGRPGRDHRPGRAAAGRRWSGGCPTSGSASATSSSAGRWASAPTS